jgi:hypothetical protein
MITFIGRVAFLASFGLLGLVTLVHEPERKDDLPAFNACIKLHPQKYCTITHLPSKVKTMEAK